MKVKEAYWPIENGVFIIPKHLVIRSEIGKVIQQSCNTLTNGTQVFIRGSMLECDQPFKHSDIDLCVIYDNYAQVEELKQILPSGLFYDVQLVKRNHVSNDFVYNALLNCRSLQIAGDAFCNLPVNADKDFALKHWIKYCPSTIPSILTHDNTFSLIYFKQLTRCFGVISFLKYGLFTRDIDECIVIAKKESIDLGQQLNDIRFFLEQGLEYQVDIHKIKKHLKISFNDNY
jgi:predicted nucleotidyltransferase